MTIVTNWIGANVNLKMLVGCAGHGSILNDWCAVLCRWSSKV